MLCGALGLLFLFQQFSAPEGPEGIVYRQGWENNRYVTLRKGRWNAWKFAGYPGNGGQPVALTPAETAQVEAAVKKIASIIESTPYAQAQIGWYADRSAGWIRTRFPEPGFPLNRLPVRSYYSLFPFNLMEKRVTVQGVKQWVPDWSHETISIAYEINPALPSPGAGLVFRENHEDGSTTQFFANPQPQTFFMGFPVYGDALVIARKNRALFRPVPVEGALRRLLPLYAKDRESAESQRKRLKEQLAEVESDEFAKVQMAEFEKEYGHLKAANPANYEFRRKTRNDWIARQRAEARAAASPSESSPDGAWYWRPVRAFEMMDRLSRSAEASKPACFEAAPESDSLYSTHGYIRPLHSAPDCKPLMEPNPEYWDASLPRTAAQLITVRQVSRCLDVSKNPPPPLPLPLPEHIPDGCSVHWKIWSEMDWKALEALLAP